MIRTQQFGFSLIELLVVIGIFAILASLALFFSIDFFRTYATNSEETTLVTALSKARSQSLANVNGVPHGVNVTAGSYTIFEGSSFAARVPSLDQVIEANSAVHPTSSVEIVFEQLSGNVAACTTPCSITMAGTNPTKTITINGEGAILW